MTVNADNVPQQPFALSAVASAGSPLDRLLTFVNVDPRSFFFLCFVVFAALALGESSL